MAVALATIRTNTWDTLYNHLQTGTYAITTNNIFSAMNDKLSTSTGYPIVIVSPPIIGRVKMTMDGLLTETTGNMLISVYHTSSQNVKAVMDEVENSIWSGRSVFSAVGMKNIEIEPGDSDSWTEGNKKKHILTTNFNFNYRGKT